MQKEGFLHHIHSFRGFAILNIVAIHAFAIAQFVASGGNIDKQAPLYIWSEMLFHDATIYFALISGLLFSAILKPYGYLRFFKNKSLYVLVPYVFCTLIFTVTAFQTDGTGVLTTVSSFEVYWNSLLKNILRGEAQFTYWYIPVVIALFILTPLLDKLTTTNNYLKVLMWVVILLPLLFSRPVFVPGEPQVTVPVIIYFAGAYTLGMYVGGNLNECIAFIARHLKLLWVIAIVASIALIAIQEGEIVFIAGINIPESTYYIQKLSIAAVVLHWLSKKGANQPKWLSGFADSAFSIFFLHAFFMLLIAHFLFAFVTNAAYIPWSTYIIIPVLFCVSLALSMLIVNLLQKLFGRRSRLLVGS